jgi:hypothetical protein
MKPVKTVKRLRDREVQRALLQFFAPENYFTVRKALEGAGREDLIGEDESCLIGSRPPRDAIAARRERAGREVPAAAQAPGYRRPARTRGRRARRPRSER